MKNMNKKNKSLMITAIALTFVLVGVVLFGTGLFGNSRGSITASAEIDENGVFTVPSATGDIGSETNPFVVLEVVPSEDMAQFGYLVANQEPIDLGRVATEEELNYIKSKISTELAINSTSYGIPFKAGFLADLESYVGYTPKATSKANQYGYYAYSATANQPFDLRKDETVPAEFVSDPNLKSYKYLVSLDPTNDEGLYGVSEYDVPFDEVNKDDLPDEYKTRDKIINVLNEYNAEIYVDCEPGTGKLSDSKYEKITVGSSTEIDGVTVDRTGVSADDVVAQSPYGGEYSLEYEYVGENNGDYEYGLISGGAGGVGDDAFMTGESHTIFRLEANGFYMDMGQNDSTKLWTEETEDTSNHHYQYFRLEDSGKKIGSETAYYIYTGNSDYEKVLTAESSGKEVTIEGVNFRMENAGDGYYYLLRKDTGKYIYYDSGDLGYANAPSNSDYYKFYIPSGEKYLRIKVSGAGYPYFGKYEGELNFRSREKDASRYTSISDLAPEYVVESARVTNDSRQLFAISPYASDNDWNRIYCSISGTKYYMTGEIEENRIKLTTSLYTGTAKQTEIDIKKIYNEAETASLTVQLKDSQNQNIGGRTVATYHLYTKDSDYTQAIIYNNDTITVGDPGTGNRFYAYTDTVSGKTYYRTTTDNGGYWYLYMGSDGNFALFKEPADPGTVTFTTETNEYALIYTDNIHRRVVRMEPAGTNGSRQLYYLYTAESGFTKAISYKNNSAAEFGTPNGENKYKFYFDSSNHIISYSGNSYSYLYFDGDTYTFKNKTVAYVRRLTLSNESEYRLLERDSRSTIVQLKSAGKDGSTQLYYLYTAESGFKSALRYGNSGYVSAVNSPSKNEDKFFIDGGRIKSYYGRSSSYPYLTIETSRDVGYECWDESSHTCTMETITGGTTTYATIVSDSNSVRVKAVETGRNTGKYYLYMGSDQLYYNNGSVGKSAANHTTSEYIFTKVTVDGHDGLKVDKSSAQAPYLYAVSSTELGFTMDTFTIPGKTEDGKDNVYRNDYLGLQLFSREEEEESVSAFRYIINVNSNRYLEVNADNGNLIQNSRTAYINNNDQIFKFVETTPGSKKYYIYTGHSNFVKVLTVSGNSESVAIKEADFTGEASQIFAPEDIMEFTGNQRIRTSYSRTYNYGMSQKSQTDFYTWSVESSSTSNNKKIIQYRDKELDKSKQNGIGATYGRTQNDQRFVLAIAPTPHIMTANVLAFHAVGEGKGSYIRYETEEDAIYPRSTGAGYTYVNSTGSVVKVKIGSEEGREYSIPAGSSMTFYLGDYDCVYYPGCPDDEGPILVVNEPGKTYGNFNISKYVFAEVSGGYKYTFTMVRLDGDQTNKGHYSWIGYSYDDCYGSEKIVTDITAYPAKVAVKVDAVSGGTLDITDAEKSTKYSKLNSYIEEQVYTLYEKGSVTRSADSFKKYAIGLAYVDGDYTKGLADAHYTFGGWYTDPNCMYQFNPETAVTKDTTLYARWIVEEPLETTCTVTFEGNAYVVNEDGTYQLAEDGKPLPDSGLDSATLPAMVEKVRKGNYISMPSTTPIRSGYVFTYWYDDPECTIRHNFSEPVADNTIVYAGWEKIEPTDVYTLEFNGNASYSKLSSVSVVSLPSVVTNYARNGRLVTYNEAESKYYYTDITRSADFYLSGEGVTPAAIQPKLVNSSGAETEYVFAGWYYYATCEEDYRFDFNKTIVDSNLPIITEEKEVDDGLGGKTKVTVKTIRLYAKWVKNTTKYTVSFDANLPAGLPSVDDMPAAVPVTFGAIIGQAEFDQILLNNSPSGLSAVEKALDNYHVRVITVTPKDLNLKVGSDQPNLKLVERANMIVINQTCSDYMRELWQKYRSLTLFSKSEAQYSDAMKTGSDRITSFTHVKGGKYDRDFNWNTTMAVFNRIAGVGVNACPIIYDYSAYSNLDSDSLAKDVTIKAKYSGGATINLPATKGSTNNVYKLYLMTQQMNPITLYNAYINDVDNQNNKNEIKPNSDGITAMFDATTATLGTNTGWVTSYTVSGGTGDAKNYWNKYTLVPYSAMTEEDHKRDGLGVIGLTDNPVIENSSIDSSKSKVAQLKNRVLLFNGGLVGETSEMANIVSSFETLIFESIGQDDLNDYLYPGSQIAPTSYKTADVLYYLIRNTSLYQNFSKNLSILEIEASASTDSWKGSTFWFWYISRYVPNYTGRSTVTTQSTYELVGDIDDLNAAYDVIYFGVNLSSSLNSYYQKTMPGESVAQYYKVGDIVEIELGQAIGAPFYTPKISDTKVITSMDVQDAEHAGTGGYERIESIPNIVAFTVEGATCTPVIPSSFDTTKNTYGLYVSSNRLTSEPDNTGDAYYFYDTNTKQQYYFQHVEVKSHYNTSGGVNISHTGFDITSSWHEAETATEDITTVYYREAGTDGWKPGYIQLNEFSAKTTYTDPEPEWVEEPEYYHAAGSFAYAGQTIKLAGSTRTQIATGNVYLYSHIGAITSTKNTRLGVFDADGGVKDDLNQFAYSGNDITKSKYDDLIDFVKAGYPVIVNSNLLNILKEVDTKKVDNSSYIYKFLTELRTDYPTSFYVDTDTTRDDEFVTSLKNKSFELVVNRRPTEYVDKTYEPTTGNKPYADYTEDKIYVNGAADGSNSNISKRDLTYEIYIDSTKPSGYYKLRMYIDTNADGRFDEIEERLDTLEITEIATGKTVNADRLQGNKAYQINRTVIEYAGILPWKLEIIDGDNNLIHDYVTGACAIKVAEKEVINVLQIIPDSGVNVYLPTDGEYMMAKSGHGGTEISSSNADTYFNGYMRSVNTAASTSTRTGKVTSTQLIKNAGWFYYYTTLLNEFEVHFYRMSVKEFVKMVGSGTAPNEIGWDTSTNKAYIIEESGHSYLDDSGDCTYFAEKNINMLILGYSDCFTDIENDRACQYIEDFISAGNTTLFTHDTTSFVNKLSKTGFNGTSDIWWGYYINKYFRDLLGMDRFGVMTNRGTYDANAPDWPFKLNSNQTQYATGSGSTSVMGAEKTRLLNQGLTNVCVGQDGARITTATKTNDGQIVNYPFKIPDTLSVASTHSQYYQLNLDAEDIVVWYCLYDTSSQYYATKNDVRNNYYIYNRGNITYSGVGHASNMTKNEYKLFVNTMIAAYQASSLATEPVITNRDRSVDTGVDYLYVDYDATLEASEAKPFGDEITGWKITSPVSGAAVLTTASGSAVNCYTKEVHFTLKNYSIILNKKMTIHYYPVVYDKNGNRVVLEDCPLDLATYVYDDIGETWEQLTEANGGIVNMVQTEVVNTKGGVSAEPIIRIASEEDDEGTNATYLTYKNLTAPLVNTTTLADGTVRTTTYTKMRGGVVDSLKNYYVAVPISDVYYQMLQSPTYRAIMEEKNDTIVFADDSMLAFALDENNHFEIEMRVIMRYGRQPYKCDPLIGTRSAIFMRRGMFKLD